MKIRILILSVCVFVLLTVVSSLQLVKADPPHELKPIDPIMPESHTTVGLDGSYSICCSDSGNGCVSYNC